MLAVISSALLLYILALHTSMAAMEIFGWALFAIALICLMQKKVEARATLQTPILIYFGVVLLNILLTPSTTAFLERISDMTWAFTFWGLVKCLEIVWSEKFEKKALYVWLVALAASTSVGVYQFFVGYDFIRNTSEHLPPVGDFFRSTGFFSLCLTFAYSMGISSFTLATPLRKYNKHLIYTAIVLGAICVLNSMTRGAWLAFIGTFVILAILYFRWLSRKQLIGMAVLLVAYAFVLIQTKRVDSLVTTHTDGAVSERFDIWKGYFQIFLDHPFLGVGYNEGGHHLLASYQKLKMSQTFVSHAHNDYLQALAETGAVGLLTYLFLLGYTLTKAYQLRTYRLDWSISLMAGQLFIYLGSLSQANFTDSEVNHFLIFNWALVSVLSSKKISSMPEPPGSILKRGACPQTKSLKPDTQ